METLGLQTLSLMVCYICSLDILLPKEPSQGFELPQLFFTTRQQTRNLGLHEAFLKVVSLPKPSNTSPGVQQFPFPTPSPQSLGRLKQSLWSLSSRYLEPSKLHLSSGKSHEALGFTDLLSLITSPQRRWAGQQVQLSLSAPIPCSL